MPTICQLPAAQIYRVVFGLRHQGRGSACAVERDTSLAAMDAPTMLPAGSHVGECYGSGTVRVVQESVVRRYRN
mgnify:CR=1 FL=1